MAIFLVAVVCGAICDSGCGCDNIWTESLDIGVGLSLERARGVVVGGVDVVRMRRFATFNALGRLLAFFNGLDPAEGVLVVDLLDLTRSIVGEGVGAWELRGGWVRSIWLDGGFVIWIDLSV